MKEFVRKIQYVLMLSLMSLPPLLALGVNGFADRMWLCAALPALYAAMAGLCLVIRGRRRLAAGIALCVLLDFICLTVLPWRETWWMLTVPAGYTVMLLTGLKMGGWAYEQELPFNVCIFGLGVYGAAQLLFLLRADLYAGVTGALVGGFLAYGALWMLLLNRQSLHDAAAKGNRAPQAMRRKNLALTVGLMLLILFVSAIPAISRALARAWRQLTEWIAAIGRFLAGLLPDVVSGGGSGGGGAPEMLMGEAVEPSLFAQIMEKIMFVVVILALAVLLVWALRIVWRKLRVLMRRLWAMLGRYAQAASEDYVDEVDDTRDMGDASASGRRRLFGDWFARVNEDKLTPVERVRYRYRRLLRRHMDWRPGSTARETIPQEAAVIYERARYSTQEVSAQEAEQFALGMKNLEKERSY